MLALRHVRHLVATLSCTTALSAAVGAGPRASLQSSARPGCAVVPGGYLAFSPDGTRLATGAILWDAQSRKRLAWMSGNRVLFAPNSRMLATRFYARGTPVPQSREVRLWDARSGKLKVVLPHPQEVTDFAFSPDGRTLATTDRDPIVRLWETATGRLRKALRGHSMGVSAVAFSPNGRTLATGSQDTTVRLWEPVTGRTKHTLRGHKRGVRSLDFSPDGKLLATAGWDTTVRLWDPRTGVLRAIARDESYIEEVTFSPNGRWLATSGAGGKSQWVALWALRRLSQGLSVSKVWEDASSILHRNLLGFSPDGRTMITLTGGPDVGDIDTYLLRDIRTRKVRWSRKSWGDGWVAFSADGRTLAVAAPKWGSMNHEAIHHVQLWDARTGKPIAALLGEYWRGSPAKSAHPPTAIAVMPSTIIAAAMSR